MRQFSRYLAVGVLNTLWSYVVIFGLMHVLSWSPEASNVMGYAVGLLTSYALHRIFTFNSRNSKGPEFARFIGIFAVAFCANFLALTMLVRLMELNASLSQIVAGAVYVVTSYTLSRSYVFRRSAG